MIPTGGALLAGWIGVGAACALHLHRRGRPAGEALACLVAWPVVLPLAWAPPASRSSRVDAAVDRLEQAIARTSLGPWREAGLLRTALRAAEERIAAVDALLREASPRGPSHAALVAARARAAADLDAVLDELDALHVQVGLLLLSAGGEPAVLRAQLAAVAARVAALAEVERAVA